MDNRNLLQYSVYIWILSAGLTTKASKFLHEPSAITLKPPLKLEGDAFFGYSITYVSSSKRLIVGAPNADNVGKIFQCNLTGEICSELPTTLKDDASQVKNSRLWNGAALEAGQSFFVSCAPRLSKYIKPSEQWVSTAKCFTYHDNSTTPRHMYKIRPYDLTVGWEKYIEEADPFGWSIGIAENNSVLVGAPAVNSGRVSLYYDPFQDEFPVVDTGRFREVENNFGYAVLLNKVNKQLRYIVSSPYGSYGKGKIVVRQNLHVPKAHKKSKSSIITDTSGVGYLFGGSMCLLRHENNEYLLVGSPAYAPMNSRKFDLGKVDVYADYDSVKPKLITTIYGVEIGGYFGHAMVNMGDLNGDEIDDVAISAPYEDGYRGAIYIYSGSTLLMPSGRISWLQKIKQEHHQFFGLSMTALKNFDDNGCIALGVGSPGNNRALVLHSFASVIVQIYVSSTSMKFKTDNNVTRFTFESCVKVKYPEKPVKIAFGLGFDTPVETKIKASHVNSPTLRLDFDPSRVVLSDLSVLTSHDKLWMINCNQSECVPNLNVSVTTSFTDEYIIGSTKEESISLSVINKGDTAYKACAYVNVTGVRVKRAQECERVGFGETWQCASQGPVWTNDVWKITDIILEMDSLTSADIFIEINTYVSENCEETSFNNISTIKLALKSDKEGIVLKGNSSISGVVNVTKGMEKQVEHTYLIINNGSTNWVDLEYELQLPRMKFVNADTDVKKLVLFDELSTCNLNENLNTSVTITCSIPSLKKSKMTKIVALIEISLLPTGKPKTTFSTNLTLKLDARIITESLSNTVAYLKVAVYVILYAVLFSLILLGIIAYILYQLGFLKRKNKEKLINLQNHVRRKSMMRQSLYASVKDENPNDEQILKEIEFIEEISQS